MKLKARHLKGSKRFWIRIFTSEGKTIEQATNLYHNSRHQLINIYVNPIRL